MRITVVSEQLADMYDGHVVDDDFVSSYLAGTDQSLIVPGVLSWDNAEVSYDDDGNIVVSADLTTEDVVSSGDWQGQDVGRDWIMGYIMGAAEYWFAPGLMKATKITFA